MKVHLWDAYNPNKISVDINKEFKTKLKHLIKNNIYKIANQIKIVPARLYEYFIYQTSPIPLDVLVNLSKLFKISLLKAEQNIILYKQMFVPNKNSIKNPKLPLETNPYLTSVVAHLYFDGSVPKDGKGTYYHQKNEEIMNDFINKIKKVFGNVEYTLRKDHRDVLKCRIPRIIGEICKSIYQIDSFDTFDSRLSEFIFKLSKEHKIAFILTAILDEGSITYDGQIFFGINNKELCKDIKKLCNKIELKTTPVKQKSDSNHYYIYIKSPKKLLGFMNLFDKKYPLISLRYKEKRLKYYFKIKKYPGLRNKKGGDERKKKILNSLKNERKSVNQLSEELLILPRSLRRHLNFLININKISKEKIGKENYFFLTKPH